MKSKFLPFLLISILIIIFIIFYRGLQNNNIYTPESNIINEVPSFSEELLYSNKIVNSSEIFNSNKFYLLNIWSSWCVPCRQEHPILMDLDKNKQIIVIGINYKDTKKNAIEFLEKFGNPYEKIFFDKEGVQSIEWGAYGVPESFIIYKNKILKKYIGPINQQSIKEIELLINENI
tara:strand:- start:298 stop:825 length:528 start_codon:yes stop_codon:yes gene_type:complete